MRCTRGWRALGLLAACLVLTGGRVLTISDVPAPLAENVIFGKIIQEIRIRGNENTRIGVIHAAMRSKVGDVYTQESAFLDYRWITQLGVFTSVQFETLEQDEGIVLVIHLTEVNRYTPAPVIKITDENGVSLGARITSSNVLGAAAKASLYFTVGGSTNFGARFKDPWIPGRSWLFGYDLRYEHADRRNEIFAFDERSDDLYFELTRNLTDHLQWGPRASYLVVRSTSPGITLSRDDVDHVPALGAFLRFDGRDLPIYPTVGWWAEMEVAKYGLGDVDTDYWQVNLDLRRYFQIGGRANSLALYTLGTMSSGEVGTEIPVYLQFNLGGANSIRGWGLGSRQGKNQFLNTAEYWHVLVGYKVWKVWFFRFALGLQLGVFGDVGTAWSDGSQFQRNWIGGGGVGVRLLTPGNVMFRFDLAAGEEGPGLRMFISGQEKAVAQRERVR
jgi:outer membrane protein assembly factor BamA